MNKYEKLLSEHENLHIEERKISIDGLYADGCIWLREDMPTSKKYCTLAEEIGHHETSSGDILDQNDVMSKRQELIARRWAYEKLVPKYNIQLALESGHIELWDMAEYLEIDETFLKEALIYYGYLSI